MSENRYYVTEEDMTLVADQIRASAAIDNELVFPSGWIETLANLSSSQNSPDIEPTRYYVYNVISEEYNASVDHYTWTCPCDSYYKFYIIGKGGNGGASGSSYGTLSGTNNYAGIYSGGIGGSGGSGACIILTVYLLKDEEIFVTFSSAGDVQFEIQVNNISQVLIASAGGNGGNGGNASSSSVGAAGIAGVAGVATTSQFDLSQFSGLYNDLESYSGVAGIVGKTGESNGRTGGFSSVNNIVAQTGVATQATNSILFHQSPSIAGGAKFSIGQDGLYSTSLDYIRLGVPGSSAGNALVNSTGTTAGLSGGQGSLGGVVILQGIIE